MACNYWCSNSEKRKDCGVCNSKGDVVIDQEGTYHCPNDETIELKLMGRTTFSVGNKLPPKEIKKDRQKRSTENFIKEHLPTFDSRSQEGKHFRKKYGIKT